MEFPYSSFVQEEYEEVERLSQEIEDLMSPANPPSAVINLPVNINGISVKFPYKAYECQRLMMANITSALEKSENCLLESPTGTGKTAALLCGLLAWQKKAEDTANRNSGVYDQIIDAATLEAGCTCGFSQGESGFRIVQEKEKRSIILKRYNEEKVSVDSLNETPNKKQKTEKEKADMTRDQSQLCRFCIRTHYKVRSVPIIYYATRTLSQIKQVIKELKNTAYSKGVQMSILAGRSHSCLNPDAKDSASVDDKCQTLRTNYRLNAKFMRSNQTDSKPHDECQRYCPSRNETVYDDYSECQTTAWDIEDLNSYSRKKLGCSYYGAIKLAKKAKIIFCTYNHLLNGGIRKSLNIELTNNILVFDEAHNIEDHCRSMATTEIKQKYIKETIIPELERALSENPAEIPKDISPILNSFLNLFRKLNSWFDHKSEKIKFNYENMKEQYRKVDHEEFDKVLIDLELTPADIEKYRSDLQKLKCVTGEDEENDYSPDSTNSSENTFKFSSLIIGNMSNLFWKLGFKFGNRQDHNGPQDFEAAFTKTVASKSYIQGKWVYTFENVLRKICLNPAITFKSLKNSAHSIIVASGTLSPLDSFQSELDTPFPIKESVPHVIGDNNVFSSVITHGPNKIRLRFNKDGQNVIINQLELGYCILNICKNVPHGVLVFLPSYTWMDQLQRTWATSAEGAPILSQIREIKKVFFEDKDKERFLRDMKDYTETISSNSNGCVLFAVLRGKVSEGIDFKDNQARAVITVGIPFGYKSDPAIAYKREYNDAVIRTTPRNLLSGHEWYQMQAFRAMNQAFGRCVRHKDDWGSLILIDQRMESENNQRQLSSWVLEKMKKHKSFGDLENYLKTFVEERQLDEQKIKEEERNNKLNQLGQGENLNTTEFINRNEDSDWLPDKDDQMFLGLKLKDQVSVAANTQSPMSVLAKTVRESCLNSPASRINRKC